MKIPSRIERMPVLRAVYRGITIVLAFIAWFGACGATLFGMAVLFDIATTIGARVSAETRGTIAILLALLYVAFFAWLALEFYRKLTYFKCIDLDFAAMILGSAAGIWYILALS